MLTHRQRADAAEAQRDGAMKLAALAVSFMTDDQKVRLRDTLVCLQFEEDLLGWR